MYHIYIYIICKIFICVKNFYIHCYIHKLISLFNIFIRILFVTYSVLMKTREICNINDDPSHMEVSASRLLQNDLLYSFSFPLSYPLIISSGKSALYQENPSLFLVHFHVSIKSAFAGPLYSSTNPLHFVAECEFKNSAFPAFRLIFDCLMMG